MSMSCPKFRFPIGVIVFDELELISFVGQGLTLSTASLVGFYSKLVANVNLVSASVPLIWVWEVGLNKILEIIFWNFIKQQENDPGH